MLTSKQRAHLKSIISTEPSIMQVGKDGITDNLLKSLSDALDARELIKISILETAEGDVRNIAENIAELLQAEVVTVIGRKAIFYRYSSRDHFIHLDF